MGGDSSGRSGGSGEAACDVSAVEEGDIESGDGEVEGGAGEGSEGDEAGEEVGWALAGERGGAGMEHVEGRVQVGEAVSEECGAGGGTMGESSADERMDGVDAGVGRQACEAVTAYTLCRLE